MSQRAVAVPQAPPHRDGNVLRWLAGFGVSLVGDQIYYVALAWTAAEPVDPLVELAQTCWLNAKLHDDIVAEREGPPPLADRARQLRAIAVAPSQTRPASWARSAIWVRLSRSSLVRMCETWVFTVARVMSSAAATSALLRP
jgi:hypothetical protein